MKIYIAGSSAEISRARRVAASLVAAGHTITSTWTDVVEQVGDANPRGASREDRAKWAYDDLYQVSDADLLVFLVPTTFAATRGAWVEVGWAAANGVLILSVGDTKQSIFTALGYELTGDHEAVDSHIAGWIAESEQSWVPVKLPDGEVTESGPQGSDL